MSVTTRLGRPRDATRDDVILEAALQLVNEVGYERVSMDAIAARAHASKATIYRRWKDKSALVAAALQCRTSGDFPAPDLGSLRADVTDVVTRWVEAFREEDLGLLAGIASAMRSDTGLAAGVRECVLDHKRTLLEPMFARARERGELTTHRGPELVAELAGALTLHRLLVTDLPADDDFIAHLVSDVLLPVLIAAA